MKPEKKAAEMSGAEPAAYTGRPPLKEEIRKGRDIGAPDIAVSYSRIKSLLRRETGAGLKAPAGTRE
ncbi:MAG: hypothetical protein LBG57_04960 [Treponema sp.]|nr:hypothetical protein [Treponema sp.]